jgi:ketosteroid isomerase-like protein
MVGIGLLVLSPDELVQVNHCRCTLTEQDWTVIRSAIEKYRTSWLAGNAGGVMAMFTDDSVLMPGPGSMPAVGREAIRKYWWPAGGPKTTITKLNITYEEIGGECGTAYARGRDEVGRSIEENGTRKSHANSGTYLNVMRRLPDGSGLISHHMWDVDPSKNQ